MQIFVNVFNDRILRISDGAGAVLTFKLMKGQAQILTIFVPEDNRKQGIGRSLLSAAQKLLLERGIKFLYADFLEGIEGLVPLFESFDYILLSEVDILAIPMRMIIYAPNIKRAFDMPRGKTTFLPLEQLRMVDKQELLAFLDYLGTPVSCYDLAHYNSNISGVVFDKAGSPVSAILCRDFGRTLYIGLLASKNPDDPAVLFATLMGLMDAVKEAGGDDRYQRLIFASYNAKIVELIKHTLGDETEFEVIDKSATMFKRLIAARVSKENFEYVMDIDEALQDVWEREVSVMPVQKSIINKAGWSRNKRHV